MAKKVLLPVLPSDRFYDAVVAAANLILAEGGGLLVFLFTELRRPALQYEDDAGGRADLLEIEDEVDDEVSPEQIEDWRARMIDGLEDARTLLRERGIDERYIDYAFADYAVPRAEAIADEAAAGGYDAVILPTGFIRVNDSAEQEPPEQIPEQLKEMGEVRVLMV
jgi:hypothetical protein